jgi:predicted double-glycine peptidase
MADATSGTGGGLRYITEEPTADMVNQALPFSCVVACVRQLLRDAGVAVSEAELIDRIGVMEGEGSTPGPAGVALTALHPRLRYQGGAVDPDADLPVLFRRDPWIAFVGTDHGSIHSVIVDRLESDTVHVRDPWGLRGPGSGSGTRATLALEDFKYVWWRALHTVVIPIAVK